MSDQIGFHYQRYQPEHAVNDFIGKLEAIGNATGGNAGHRPTLVSIILDGENCWEYYPNAGRRVPPRRVSPRGAASEDQAGAHRRLSRPLARHRQDRPPLPRQLDPAQLRHLDRPSRVQSGVGLVVRNAAVAAWRVAARKSKPAENIARAWEELYIAEGSDWFWWFGDSHSSAQDGLFDRLFRKHLQNVYQVLGEQPPTELARARSAKAAATRKATPSRPAC